MESAIKDPFAQPGVETLSQAMQGHEPDRLMAHELAHALAIGEPHKAES